MSNPVRYKQQIGVNASLVLHSVCLKGSSVFIFRRDGKSLERFLEDYFANRLKRYVKTEAVPESNDGPVKVDHKHCVLDLN